MFGSLGAPEFENPLRKYIVRGSLGMVFPVTAAAAFLMGLWVRWSGGYSLGTTNWLSLALVAIAIGGGVAAWFGSMDWWHTPARVTVEGDAVRYRGLRWSLVFPKRLDLEMERSSFDHVGRARWGGAAPLTGVARIRNDPFLEGRPYRDFIIVSPEILARLAIGPGMRFRA